MYFMSLALVPSFFGEVSPIADHRRTTCPHNAHGSRVAKPGVGYGHRPGGGSLPSQQEIGDIRMATPSCPPTVPALPLVSLLSSPVPPTKLLQGAGAPVPHLT